MKLGDQPSGGFVVFIGDVFRAGVCGVPAPGFRDAGSYGRLGNLMVVDHSGYSWSSTVSGTNGVHLGFNVTWLDPSNADNRAHSFQLRCLSE